MADEILITAPEFKVFAKRLRGVDDKAFRRLAGRRLKSVGDAAADAARNAASQIPSHVVGKPELRPMLAAAVATQMRSSGRLTGVSVTVRSSRLGSRAGAAKVLEFGGRHPVYGHDAWVDQAPSPWWRDAVAPFREKALIELTAVVDEISRLAGFK